jgi:hypothetical protein
VVRLAQDNLPVRPAQTIGAARQSNFALSTKGKDFEEEMPDPVVLNHKGISDAIRLAIGHVCAAQRRIRDTRDGP